MNEIKQTTIATLLCILGIIAIWNANYLAYKIEQWWDTTDYYEYIAPTEPIQQQVNYESEDLFAEDESYVHLLDIGIVDYRYFEIQDHELGFRYGATFSQLEKHNISQITFKAETKVELIDDIHHHYHINRCK